MWMARELEAERRLLIDVIIRTYTKKRNKVSLKTD